MILTVRDFLFETTPACQVVSKSYPYDNKHLWQDKFAGQHEIKNVDPLPYRALDTLASYIMQLGLFGISFSSYRLSLRYLQSNQHPRSPFDAAGIQGSKRHEKILQKNQQCFQYVANQADRKKYAEIIYLIDPPEKQMQRRNLLFNNKSIKEVNS